jgi:hypothetical protein
VERFRSYSESCLKFILSGGSGPVVMGQKRL